MACLSLAFRNLRKDEADAMTERYKALGAHYGMTVPRNDRGVAHGNGSSRAMLPMTDRTAARDCPCRR